MQRTKFFILLFLLSCNLNNKVQNANPNCKISTQANLGPFDHYQFKNDSFEQNVYVHYFSKRRLRFFLQISGIRNKCTYELADTAVLEGNIGDDPGVVDDDDLDSGAFPVYAYIYTKGHPNFYIEVEPSRGPRMILTPVDDSADKANCLCSIRSLGVLRCINRSYDKQLPPELPK